MSTGRARLHRGYVTIECEAEVPIEDILRDMSDDELRRECASRGIVASPAKNEAREDWINFTDDLRAAFSGRDGLHFEVLIVRMLAMAAIPRLTILKAKESI